MLLTPHTLMGIAVASAIPNPYISVPISFVLHFVGDAIPHWDFFTYTQKEERRKGWRTIAVMADLIIGVALGIGFVLYALWVKNDPSLSLNIFLCGVISVLPDALEGPYIYMDNEPKILQPLTKLQRRIQFPIPLPWGMLTQAVVVVAALLLISSSII